MNTNERKRREMIEKDGLIRSRMQIRSRVITIYMFINLLCMWCGFFLPSAWLFRDPLEPLLSRSRAVTSDPLGFVIIKPKFSQCDDNWAYSCEEQAVMKRKCTKLCERLVLLTRIHHGDFVCVTRSSRGWMILVRKGLPWVSWIIEVSLRKYRKWEEFEKLVFVTIMKRKNWSEN